ncbi:hypothetical protein AO67_04075 [Mycobacterium tuberculosis M2003]|nr:hypothetical protein AO67_04075 [Mycobacterium tuberculosis M2003]
MSSDPKPREGTETFLTTCAGLAGLGRQTQNPERGRKLDCANWLGADPGGRQTQNPERGRKRGWWASWRWGLSQVVRPKTPRGDGNSKSSTTSAAAACSRSRQTQNPERGRKPASGKSVRSKRFQRVVRPKTPRGDGNNAGDDFRCCGSHCRQTQNPERGRKPGEQRRRQPGGHGSVVRPKTPRGDGNLRQPFRCDADGRLGSSDLKPREGTETSSTIIAIPSPHVSSDPKPREGTETSSTIIAIPSPHVSSDPKPREGTETLNNAQ